MALLAHIDESRVQGTGRQAFGARDRTVLDADQKYQESHKSYQTNERTNWFLYTLAVTRNI